MPIDYKYIDDGSGGNKINWIKKIEVDGKIRFVPIGSDAPSNTDKIAYDAWLAADNTPQDKD